MSFLIRVTIYLIHKMYSLIFKKMRKHERGWKDFLEKRCGGSHRFMATK
jgi:hypothetical protein